MSNNSVVLKFDGILIVLIMLLLTTHDYLFNKILFHTPFYYLALWKDFLVVALFLYFFITTYLHAMRTGELKKYNFYFLIIISIFLFVAAYGFNNGVFDNISNYRYYFLTIFFSIVIALLINININRNIKYFEYGLYLSTLLSVLYGFYQYITISSPEDFWYWNHFISLGYDQNVWDVFRGGKPRISSFYTSSLDYSMFLLASFAFFLSFLYRSVLEKNDVKVLINVFFLTIIFYSIYISTVRSALIGAFGVVLLFVGFFLFRNKYSRLLLSIIVFVGFTVLTFGYIYLGLTKDLSALGRLTQWSDFFDQLLLIPFFGFGVDKTGVRGIYWYDSFWINYFLSFGLLLGGGVILFLVSVYTHAIRELSLSNNRVLITFYFPLFLIGPVFSYLFFFQSFSRTSSLYMFLAMLFLVFFNKRKHFMCHKYVIKK